MSNILIIFHLNSLICMGQNFEIWDKFWNMEQILKYETKFELWD